MNRKNAIYSIITLILAIIIAGGFWTWKGNQKVKVIQQQSQTENQNQERQQTESQQVEIDMSDWKTYRNEEYGFEIKYPSVGWTIAKIDDSFEYQELAICSDDNFYGGDNRSCVSVSPNRLVYGEDIFLDFIKNKSDKLVRFNFKDHEAFMLPGEDGENEKRYQNWIVRGNNYGCAAYKNVYFRVENVPNNWKTKHEQFGISCENERVIPVIKKIVDSFRFLK
jgi:hypothetical protein